MQLCMCFPTFQRRKEGNSACVTYFIILNNWGFPMLYCYIILVKVYANRLTNPSHTIKSPLE